MKITNLFKFGVHDGDEPWRPTYKWLAVTAGAILALLIITFFALNILLKPYMRVLPIELTPWLDKSKKEAVIQQPNQIEQEKNDVSENQTANS
jgi:hypothetical protein